MHGTTWFTYITKWLTAVRLVFSRWLCKAEQNNQLKANAKQLKYVDNHLQLLNKLSVLRDIFQINVQPNIATINGLRLGNLKSNPVCWLV